MGKQKTIDAKGSEKTLREQSSNKANMVESLPRNPVLFGVKMTNLPSNTLSLRL